MSTTTMLSTASTSPATSTRRRALPLAALALAAIVAWTFGGARPADAAPLRAAKASASAATTTAAADAGGDEPAAKKRTPKELTGKLNVNTASEDQLMLLPGVGPAMSERIIGYRTKNGAFKRVADLRKVKGIGYKTLKKLEPYLDVKGDTTLAEK